MFILHADKNEITIQKQETVTSGAVNVFPVRFEFSSNWDGLERVAVFTAGQETKSVLLGPDDQCNIPWEVLKKPGVHLFGGACGKRDGEIVLPTVWANLGLIRGGAVPEQGAYPSTPELWQQELDRKGDALGYTDDGDLGLYSGDKLLSSVPVTGGGEGTPGEPGKDGATFTPSVSEDGTLSWTNDGGLPNPEPVDIKGTPGKDGRDGPPGLAGPGLPPGGTTGQIPAKASDSDYDVQWIDPPEGGENGVTHAELVQALDGKQVQSATQAQYNGMTQEQKRGLWVVTDANSNGGGPAEEVYSTEEIRIGTWIDGKPLYRISFAAVTPNGSGNVGPAIENIDVLVKMDGLIEGKNGFKTTINCSTPNWYVLTQFDSKNSKVIVYSDLSAFHNCPVTVTLEYTKTTDQGVQQ